MMTTTRKMFAVLTLLAGGMVISAGCSPECDAGAACNCSGGTCDLTCESETGGNCALNCTDGATCKFDCPGGNCSVNCTDAKSCEVSCPGNTCGVSCSATTSVCKITECSTACVLQCGGAETCESSCESAQLCATNP